MSGIGDVENQGGGVKAKSVLFLAVVTESSAEVVVFDARGEPRTFTHEAGESAKVCFSSHGHDADDLLTPCFNDEGNHGDPEESCFCGIDTPHLHAHIHDPAICDADEGGCGSKKKTQGRAEDALMKLAKLTILPTDEEDEVLNAPLLHIPVSDQMPNECNAHAFLSGLTAHAHAHAHETSRRHRKRMHKVQVRFTIFTLHVNFFAPLGTCFPSCLLLITTLLVIANYSLVCWDLLQHGDHVDYLMVDEGTGELLLVHPHAECGKDDVHGRFNCIGKRKLSGALGGNDVHLHFFEEAPRKFSVLEYIKSRYETDSGLLAAIRPVETHTAHNLVTHSPSAMTAPKKDCCSSGVCTAATILPPELLDPIENHSKTVRSTIACSQICCSSEIPGINKVMESLDGVSKTMINVPLKQVSVDHDPSIITAKEIEVALNKARFGATVKRDGGALFGGGVGRSQFHVQRICCASEIPAINKILEPIDGVSNVAISVTTKMVCTS
jgi:copper chaperone CopZ